MNKFFKKITIIVDNFFSEPIKEDPKYDRHAPREIENTRAAKLAMENKYSYSIMKELVERYPEYSDKDLYHCAEGLNWGLSWNTLDKFYQNRKKDEK